MNHLQFSLLFLAFISFHLSAAQPSETLVLPVSLYIETSLYTIPLRYRWGGGISPDYTETHHIDLDAALVTRLCPSPRSEIGCATPECSKARTYLSPTCPPSTLNVTDKNCKCIATAVNPFNGECALAIISSYHVIIPQTNGRNPTVDSHAYQLFVSCPSFRHMGVYGAGLSRAPLALPNQLSATNKFALCIPRGKENKGVIFFGDGPYYLNASPDNVDLRESLGYTPLLKHRTTPEYFIGLRGISINGKVGYYGRNAFDLDKSGKGGIKISTVVRYTTLRSDIYRTFVKEFSVVSRDIPRVQKKGQFDFCINTKNLTKEKSGWVLPTISLELMGGVVWPIFAANSMKEVSKDVACLAFVDGGKKAQHAIVIGTYQLENNFFVFDLSASRLGVMPSLLLYDTTCGGFNFTRAA
ncbi:hypothetical protein L6164_025600 [Bauhinia variegata]|uniref:Uncharacterized protein n=1 Tax=Bauhinia variegata TaxID=167791 RepID=A0ACB9M123_BAUVA|nr:hypothetical protein L6164_025600 [Bauhinia variegata]